MYKLQSTDLAPKGGEVMDHTVKWPLHKDYISKTKNTSDIKQIQGSLNTFNQDTSQYDGRPSGRFTAQRSTMGRSRIGALSPTKTPREKNHMQMAKHEALENVHVE